MKKILAAFSALFKPVAASKSHREIIDPPPTRPVYDPEITDPLPAQPAYDPEITDPLPAKPAYDPEILVSGFGYKLAWVAIRSDDELAVANALGLGEACWLPWESAVNQAYSGEAVGVTPAVDGWVLVFGRKIFGWQSDYDYGPVNKLAERFEEVQYFATHRVSEGHIWARWLKGRRVRLMEYIDGGLREEGPRTEAEAGILVPRCPDEAPEWISVDEDNVMMVAEKWSINPDTLEERELKASHVLAGKLPA